MTTIMAYFQGRHTVTTSTSTNMLIFSNHPAGRRKSVPLCLLLLSMLLLRSSAWVSPPAQEVLVQVPSMTTMVMIRRRQPGSSVTAVVNSRSRSRLFSVKNTGRNSAQEHHHHQQQQRPPQHISLHHGCVSLVLSMALFLGGWMHHPMSEASASESSPPSSVSSSSPPGQQPYNNKYWSIMASSSSPPQERVLANEALLDFAVGTVNTQFYDNTGGAFFAPREFYSQWKLLKRVASGEEVARPHIHKNNNKMMIPADIRLDTREGAVQGLKWLVGSLNDPFSKYLTREELEEELVAESNGFLGTGAVVEAPHTYNDHEFSSFFGPQEQQQQPSSSSSSYYSAATSAAFFLKNPKSGGDQYYHHQKNNNNNNNNKKILTITRAANLPVVTAVAPDFPAERAGVVVGDRIVAVGDQDFLGWTRSQVQKQLSTKYNQRDYFGQAELTVAKPIYYAISSYDNDDNNNNNNNNERGDPMIVTTGGDLSSSAVSTTPPLFFPSTPIREVVLGYRPTRVRLPIAGAAETMVQSSSSTTTTGASSSKIVLKGGDSIVHYQLLTSQSGGIFDHPHSSSGAVLTEEDNYKVGYIRLTRFSKASTTRYVEAVQALEEAGAQSYILDVRNNYGGVIQEAMLTASTMLRDPHAVLCYTMNARGGFTPHDAEEYIVDSRYPGYLLSSESKHATIDQVQKENPAMFVANGLAWDPPSSYASLHEQVTKRGIRRIGYRDDLATILEKDPVLKAQFQAQKKVVLLINEGTASAAEVFVAALHDNARTVAVVGTKSYGKGLIQHTFPMPDGGGLRLTVAEYLTPALSHVTTVGGARFDPHTGELVGGGIHPDIVCESKQGIPGNIRADLCVGVALDVLEEAAEAQDDTIAPPSSGLLAGISSQLLGRKAK